MHTLTDLPPGLTHIVSRVQLESYPDDSRRVQVSIFDAHTPLDDDYAAHSLTAHRNAATWTLPLSGTVRASRAKLFAAFSKSEFQLLQSYVTTALHRFYQ